MPTGIVYLIGAGPGCADLLTLRGRRAIQQSQVIVIDDLLPLSFLEDLGICRGEKTLVRLSYNKHRRTQSEINYLLLEAANKSKTVARVKNGDPFIFGRGMEEAEFLSSHGIAWEVIPGISSAVAGPASVSLALTRRGQGRSVAMVTARCAGGETNKSLPAADSLVLFMAVEKLGEITAQLIEDGWAGETPATIIAQACNPWQRQVPGSLLNIADAAKREGIKSPAILLLGKAVHRPTALKGRKTILFTGLDPANFRTLGDILHWPALQIVRQKEGYQKFSRIRSRLENSEFSHVVFTSRVGVKSFIAALRGSGKDFRLLAGPIITACGAGTAGLLSEYGLQADLVPKEPGSKGILKALRVDNGQEVLLVQGSHAPIDLQQKIESQGGAVTRLALHRIEPNPGLGQPLPKHDIIYFVSPSGVEAWWNIYGIEGFQKSAWCIGEVTRSRLIQLGVEAKVVKPYGNED